MPMKFRSHYKQRSQKYRVHFSIATQWIRLYQLQVIRSPVVCLRIYFQLSVIDIDFVRRNFSHFETSFAISYQHIEII